MFFIASHAECDYRTRAIRKYFKRLSKMRSIPAIMLLFQGRISTNTLTDAQKSDIMEFLTGKSYSV